MIIYLKCKIYIKLIKLMKDEGYNGYNEIISDMIEDYKRLQLIDKEGYVSW